MSEKLTKVLDLLIAEDRDEAAKALNEWFAEQQAAATARLMEADETEEDLDESVTITIDTDGEAEVANPVSEGNFNPDDHDDDEVVDSIINAFVDDNGGDVNLKGQDLLSVARSAARAYCEALEEYGDSAAHENLEGYIEELIGSQIFKNFVANNGGQVDEAEEADVDGDDFIDGEEEVGVDADDSAVEELSVDDRVEDLEAQLEALRAEFEALMGADADDADDADADEEGEEEIIDGDSDEEETEGDDEVEEAIAPGVPGKKTTFTQKSGIDFGGHQRIREDEELEEDFDDLAESADHHLEPVKAEKLKKEGETTGVGKTVKVQKDSPIPQRKPDERLGGDPVEIKGKTHKGYARETAPTVVGGNEKFKNSQKTPKKISKEGDKSAELNKNKEDKSAKSPINGDPKLRGKDLSRK